MKKLLVIIGLACVISPVIAGRLGGTNLGVVTGVASKQVEAKQQSIIVTSSGRVFTAFTQYTNVAEIGAILFLVSGQKTQHLCNIKGGVCAVVEFEQK